MSIITQSMLDDATTIEIVSGEGENGTVEEYTGARTAGAISARLKIERCGGDRWAFAKLDGERYDSAQ